MDLPKGYVEKLKAGGLKKNLKITSERQELIQQFTDKINLERVGTIFTPATWKQVNGLVSFFTLRDLYWLSSVCEKASSFSKKFFGVLRDTRVKMQKKK